MRSSDSYLPVGNAASKAAIEIPDKSMDRFVGLASFSYLRLSTSPPDLGS